MLGLGKYNGEYFFIGTAKIKTATSDQAQIIMIVADGPSGEVELKRECAFHSDDDWRNIKNNWIKYFTGMIEEFNNPKDIDNENKAPRKKREKVDLAKLIAQAKAGASQ